MGSGNGDIDNNHVSRMVKYLLFFSHVFYWLCGAVMILIGAWAFHWKSHYSGAQLYSEGLEFDFYRIVFDLTLVVVIFGCMIFSISFLGCLGALRENLPVLKFFSYILLVVLLCEIIIATLAFIFSTEVKGKLETVLSEKAIVKYKDTMDVDFEDMMDWVQEKVKCCGVTEHGYRDWSNNAYYLCNDTNRSAMRCSVPPSCCIVEDEPMVFEAKQFIYTHGCSQAVVDLIRGKLFVIAYICCGLVFPQVTRPPRRCNRVSRRSRDDPLIRKLPFNSPY